MNSSAQNIQHLFNQFLMDYMQVNKHTTSGQLLMVNTGTQQAIIKFISCFSSNQFVEFLVCARK